MALSLAASGLLLATPGADGSAPRSAGPTVVLHDGPGDVWTFSDAADVGYQPAEQPLADVLRARVTHGAYAVKVRMVLDDLQRVDRQWFYCDVHTHDATANFIVEAKQGHWGGIAYQDVQGEWVQVPGVSHDIDYASDVVTLRIARSLLDRPAWVRVRLRNELGLTDGSTFFTDNPATAGVAAEFTPRLFPPSATGAGSSRR